MVHNAILNNDYADNDINNSPMKVGVAIPTFNEKDTLELLVQRLQKVSKSIQIPFYIVIVDDNSTDGTGKLADSLSKKNRYISVIHRPGKLGLGSAYKDAFKFLLKDSKINVIMEMDADLSHKPEYIPSLLAKIDEGYDVAIGSRYIDGGGIDKAWSPMRRLISKSANFLTVLFIGLNLKDVTSGFRAYESYALKTINLDKVRTNGYAFQIDLLSQCKKVGCEIAEAPITFYERKHGKSKLASHSILEFVKTLENAFALRVLSLVEKAFRSSSLWITNSLWIGIKPLHAAIKQANSMSMTHKNERNITFQKSARVINR